MKIPVIIDEKDYWMIHVYEDGTVLVADYEGRLLIVRQSYVQIVMSAWYKGVA